MINKENEELLERLLQNLHKSTLAIPILKEYQVIPETTNAIFIAKSQDESIQQYLEDGQLEEDETFEQRIDKVLQETQSSMIENGFENKGLEYLGTFRNFPFEFKLYLQDNIKEEKQIRQINAYFIEPESNYFYEVTLAAPPMYAKDVNDNVTKNILGRLRFILGNIKYNESCPF